MLRFDHLGVIVEDLDAAAAFFVSLGFEHGGRGMVDGKDVDRINGLDGIVDGLREQGFDLVGETCDYGNSYRLCYVRGPEGLIVELAENISPNRA